MPLLLAGMQAISSTSDTYKFPVLETDNAVAPLPEEIRLNQNDEFVSYEVAYYVAAETSLEAEAEFAEGKSFFTYAPAELSSAFVALFRAWTGNLQILVNKISRLERWDLKKHNIVPRTQFQNSTAAIPVATFPSMDYSEHGTFPMQPMLTLSGAKKNDIIITLQGGAVPSTTTGAWTLPDAGVINFAMTHLALFFRGMLAQNAAKFQ